MSRNLLALLLCAGISLITGCSPTDQGAAAHASVSPEIYKMSVALSTDCTASVGADGVEMGACENGCNVVHKPDGYPIFLCPSPVKQKCQSPPDDAKGCWAPPQTICGGSGAALTWGCSPDATKCCAFTSTCQPCGWVNCMNPTAQTKAACSVPHADGQWEMACPVGLREQMQCEACGGGLVCPVGTPTNVVAP